MAIVKYWYKPKYYAAANKKHVISVSIFEFSIFSKEVFQWKIMPSKNTDEGFPNETAVHLARPRTIAILQQHYNVVEINYYKNLYFGRKLCKN